MRRPILSDLPLLRPAALIFAAAMSMLPVAALANSTPCTRTTHDGQSYVICEVEAGEDLRVWHSRPTGGTYGSFSRIDADLRLQGLRLGFAMNGGMYHSDRSPVGLLVNEGAEESPIVTASGPGNFGMLPNGVFCIGDRFSVVESRSFAKRKPACRYATQSGPMLVIEGRLHPRFIAGSDSRHIRNGVGVSADGRRAIFAISDQPVTFHEFARLFRDGLRTPSALYLDGKISRLFSPALRRNDFGFPMGPIVGVAVPDRNG